MSRRLKLYQAIAIVCSALGLTTACFYNGPSQPPPPDVINVSARQLYFKADLGGSSPSQTISVVNLSQQMATLEPQAKWFPTRINVFNIDKTDCGLTLAPGASCTVAISFHPTSQKPVFGFFLLEFNQHETHHIYLRGTVTPAAPSVQQ